jgi:hypothetical protein
MTVDKKAYGVGRLVYTEEVAGGLVYASDGMAYNAGGLV